MGELVYDREDYSSLNSIDLEKKNVTIAVLVENVKIGIPVSGTTEHGISLG